VIECCGAFRAEDSWRLANKIENSNYYHKRRLELGICPKCNKFVVALHETNLKTGYHKVTIFKERKAYKAFEEFQKEKLNNEYSVRNGNKANMNWRFCENKEVKDSTGNVILIRHYIIDFNGAKKLISQVPVDYNNNIYYMTPRLTD
jgi:hypothetical protein